MTLGHPEVAFFVYLFPQVAFDHGMGTLKSWLLEFPDRLLQFLPLRFEAFPRAAVSSLFTFSVTF